MRMHIPRKLSAALTITAAIGTFGVCGWALVHDHTENQRTYEQAVATYDPPEILNYTTKDPDDVWAGGGS